MSGRPYHASTRPKSMPWCSIHVAISLIAVSQPFWAPIETNAAPGYKDKNR